ncbi:MAG TPA: M1 family metallopeptidase [Kofleriaceae bacterium]
MPALAAPATKPIEKALVVADLPLDVPERLPRTFQPKSYAARLHVDPAQPAFSGTIEITGELTEPLALIWLHAEQLTIHRVVATRGATRVPMLPSLLPRGVLALRSEQPLDAGDWTLAITYSGTWEDRSAAGGFRQRSVGKDYVFTQFQPDFARRVFPSFDEPDRKVPWQLTLDVPGHLVAASNTPIESETSATAQSTSRAAMQAVKTVRFAKTLPLPSYLIAFAVGPFTVVDAGTSKSGIPIRILIEQDAKAASHAAASTAKLLDNIETWLGVPFPYPKVDVVAVPRTEPWWFAMENAGLITIDDLALNDANKWDSVISHELAHHWFGNLVTLAWWDEIWLNESFAYWIGDKLGGDQNVQPPVIDDPIVVANTGSPRPQLGSNQYFQNSSSLAVHKGGRLLDLLETTLGEARLLQVLRTYLTQHAHGTARSSDLRAALTAIAGDNLSTVFDRYLYSPTESLALDLRCTPKTKRVEVKGFGTTGLLCVTYDHDGTRKEQCGKLEWGSAAVELSPKRCPRWLYAKALHDIKWTAPQLEAIRDHGWSALTSSERLAVVASLFQRDPSRGRLRLSFIDKTSDTLDETLISWVANYLLMIDKYVAPAQRSHYEAWIRKRFAARARALGIRSPEPERDAFVHMQPLLWLVMSARDPGLIADALALLPKLDELAGPARALVLRAAILDKPSYADDLIAELPTASSVRVNDIAFALDAVPDPLFFLTKHAGVIRQLQHHHKSRLLGLICDETRRKDVESLGRQLFDKFNDFMLRDYEWCITERKALEPELRAFLDGANALPKPSQKRR